MWSEGDGQEVWEGREGDAGVGWGQGGREVGGGRVGGSHQGRKSGKGRVRSQAVVADDDEKPASIR